MLTPPISHYDFLLLDKITRIIQTMATIIRTARGRFHKDLRLVFGLKFKTLVLNSVKNVLSQQV